MKKIIYISILAVTMLLAGCERVIKEDPAPEGTEQLLLSASSKSLTKAGTKTDQGTDPDPTTELLPDGLDVGIYVHDRDAEEGVLPLANNEEHVSKEGILLHKKHIPISLVSGRNYSVLGYSPCTDIASGGHTAVPFQHGDEVIMSLEGRINDVSSERNSVSLAFAHKTVQIHFKVGVKFPDGTYRDGVKAGTTITATGFHKNATLDLTTGILLPVDDGEVAEMSATTGQNELADYFLEISPTSFFLPENKLITLEVTINYDGKTLKLPGGISRKDWTVGRSYEYTISINEQYSLVEVEMVDISHIPWQPGTEGDDLVFPY